MKSDVPSLADRPHKQTGGQYVSIGNYELNLGVGVGCTVYGDIRLRNFCDMAPRKSSTNIRSQSSVDCHIAALQAAFLRPTPHQAMIYRMFLGSRKGGGESTGLSIWRASATFWPSPSGLDNESRTLQPAGN